MKDYIVLDANRKSLKLLTLVDMADKQYNVAYTFSGEVMICHIDCLDNIAKQKLTSDLDLANFKSK